MQFTDLKDPIIATGLPDQDYRDDLPGISQSSAKAALEELDGCPAKFKFLEDNPQDWDTPAMSLGRLIHTAILEPDQLANYRVLDEPTKQMLLERAQAAGSKAREFSKRLSTYKEWLEEAV